MASLDMHGPYDFNEKTIESMVKEKKIGNYALGHTDDNNFHPKYVGRSDTDLQAELINRLEKKHPQFKFSYAASPAEAFKKECQNYHDFEKTLENEIHPAAPEGSDLKCHVCKN